MLATASAPQTARHPGAGLACMALAALSFALAAVVFVYCQDDLSVWHLVLIRSAVFVVLLLPWWAAHRPEAWGANRTGLLARGLAGTFMTLRFFYSFAHIPLAVGMALIRSFPIWVVLLLWVFTARRPTWGELAALAVGLVGIVVIYRPQDYADAGISTSLALARPWGAHFARQSATSRSGGSTPPRKAVSSTGGWGGPV